MADKLNFDEFNYDKKLTTAMNKGGKDLAAKTYLAELDEIQRSLKTVQDIQSKTSELMEDATEELREKLRIQKELAVVEEAELRHKASLLENARLSGKISEDDLATAREQLDAVKKRLKIEEEIKDLQKEASKNFTAELQEIDSKIQDLEKLKGASKGELTSDQENYLKELKEERKQLHDERVKDLREFYSSFSNLSKKDLGKKLLNDLREKGKKTDRDSLSLSDAKKIFGKQNSSITDEGTKNAVEGVVAKEGTEALATGAGAAEIGAVAGGPVGVVLEVVNAVGEVAAAVVDTIRPMVNGIVDGAADTIKSYYGPITGALEGVTGEIKDFKSLNSSLIFDVGISTLVEQTKILDNINSLTRSGITSDLEALGVLQTIKDKTVASFDVQNDSLRRLVRLNQQRGNLTAKQFGLADALKESFNATFGDTSFLNSMYQSLTSTVLDAVSANSQAGTDSTEFYSVIEGWLGAMYEAGVDSGTINSIAQGVNYLGSGNIQALSGNKTLQNLLLLSADRAGLDFASILQTGLSTNDANLLLSEIIDYLAEITSTTKDNNVLQSSYANLFNMSITDMTAIQNLSKSGYTAQIINGAAALAKANDEINSLSERISISERIDNLYSNAKYAFGSSIASSGLAYSTYRSSNFTLNLLGSIEKMLVGESRDSEKDKVIGTIYDLAAGPTKKTASIFYLASILPGVLGLGKGVAGSILNTSLLYGNTLGKIVSSISSGGAYDGGKSFSVTSGNTGGINRSGSDDTFKQFSNDTLSQGSTLSDTTTWENDASNVDTESDSDKILKEFEKTLMKAKEGDGYAFAVSLQGMSDGVLRSFASIFADEDAMMQTMTGENNALEENNTFIDFINDTTTKDASSKNKTGTSKK